MVQSDAWLRLPTSDELPCSDDIPVDNGDQNFLTPEEQLARYR